MEEEIVARATKFFGLKTLYRTYSAIHFSLMPSAFNADGTEVSLQSGVKIVFLKNIAKNGYTKINRTSITILQSA